MQPNCRISIDIPFHDVDMLHVVWHGHYYKYFELARTALFRKYDFDVAHMKKLGYYMVVTESYCRYARPLRYGMDVWVTARLVEMEYRLVIEYEITDGDGQHLARGRTIQVTMEAATHNLLMVTPPKIIDIFSGEPAGSPDQEEESDGG